jgi:hypothetical protein
MRDKMIPALVLALTLSHAYAPQTPTVNNDAKVLLD